MERETEVIVNSTQEQVEEQIATTLELARIEELRERFGITGIEQMARALRISKEKVRELMAIGGY